MGNLVVQRAIFPQIQAHLSMPEITVLIGPRQSGKTTLINQLKDDLMTKGVPPSTVYYFNLDVLSDREVFRDQTRFIQFLKNRVTEDQTTYVFVDEAQRVREAGIFFKGVYDLDLPIKLCLTGSSSLEIRAKIFEPLTGRKQLFKLYPFSFAEYLSFCDESLLNFISSNDIYDIEKIKTHLQKFLITGGYPKVATATDPGNIISYLEEIVSSYVERDIVGLAKIKDSDAFGRFLKVLAEGTGNLLNIERTGQEIGIKSETLSKYLSILEKTFVANAVRPYFRSYRAEIRKMPKVYFIDNGLRLFLMDGKNFIDKHFLSRIDRGVVLESFVFEELLKAGYDKINYWRTKDGSEVDFVLQKSTDLVPIEVKAIELSDDSITRSFSTFLERYQPREAYIVNLKFQGDRKIGTTTVHFLLPYQLVNALTFQTM